MSFRDMETRYLEEEKRKDDKRLRRKQYLAVACLMVLLTSVVGFMGYQLGSENGIHVSGRVTVYVIRDGHKDFWFSSDNVITNVGRNLARDQIGGTPIAVFDYVEVGTGTGGGATSTALVTPFSTRQQGSYTDVTDYEWEITTTFAAGFFDGEDITEFGCFNAASGPSLFSYVSDAGRVLTAADSLQVIWEYSIT
jgi:hypothetical protein